MPPCRALADSDADTGYGEMVAEAVLLEFDAGTTRPDTRAAPLRYLR
jgi:hypothetical protein